MTPSRRPLVLVVEDDRVLQDLVAELLLEAGYDVTTASDGDEALKLAREHAPDLILLDVTMPRLDGYAVLREIRAAGPTAPPVIFLTALGNVSDRVAGLDLGAVDYLVKPFNPPELEARVRAALRTKAVHDALAAGATADRLTGLLNRREIEVRAEAAIAHARRYQTPLACVLFDVHGIQEVEDAYGRPAAAAVLRAVAHRLQAVSRRSDILARYDDQVFLLLLPETDARGATTTADRIRHQLMAEPVPLAAPLPAQTITASVGVANWSPRLADAPALIAAAARALVRAGDGDALDPTGVVRAEER